MNSEKPHPLEGQTCPFCGGPLELGSIVGHQRRLRWRNFHNPHESRPLTRVPERFYLSAGWWFSAPSVTAARCSKCGKGVFTCDDATDSAPLQHAAVAIQITLFAVIAFVCLCLAVITHRIIGKNLPYLPYSFVALGGFCLLVVLLNAWSVLRRRA